MDIIQIQNLIFDIRGHKIMVDMHLAEMYGVETRVLKQAVSRNKDRFPDDFMFSLTKKEWADLVIKNDKLFDSQKFSPVLPFVFTEQGIAMLSSVLRSPQAVQVNINIMRAFVSVRRMVGQYEDIMKKIKEMESKYDKNLGEIYAAINYLMEGNKQNSEREPIGFKSKNSNV